MSSVRFENVTKRYGREEEPAVRDLTLEISEHEFFVLLGPSGCGKSTLLKLLAGLEEPEEGRIFLDRDLVNYMPPGRRNIAMVFQNYALYPQMTVAENIEFPLRMRRIAKRTRADAARSVAASLALGALLQRRVGDLSGGQRQRVAVARALVREPRVLLMDEPLSNLDAVLRVETREELMRLHRASSRTVIYVTHDQVEATTMATRVGVMREGCLEQVGTPETVYLHPANTFVAGFVGSPPMNLIEGRLSDHETGHEVRIRDADAAVAAFSPGDVRRPPGNGEVTIGVRPEDIRIVPPGTGSMDGAVRLRESIGADQVLVVGVPGHELRVRVPRTEQVGEGDGVGLAWDDEALHLFDLDGARIEITSPTATAAHDHR